MMIFQTTISSRRHPPTAGTTPRHGATGFTLIEVLMVAVVVLLLFVIATPMFVAAVEKSQVTRANVEVRQLQSAWNEYYRTYNTWFATNSFAMSAAKAEILAGDAGATSYNTNRIKFMQCTVEQLVDGFNDPWNNPYEVTFVEKLSSTNRVYQSKVYFKHASRYR